MVFLYLALFLIYLLIIIKNVKKTRLLTIKSTFLLSIVFLYLFIPAIVFFVGSKYQNEMLIGIILNTTYSDRLSALFVIVLALSVFRLSYGSDNITFRANRYLISSSEALPIIKRISYKWFVVLLILGVIGYVIMLSQVGLLGFVRSAGVLRQSSEEYSNPMLSYGMMLARCVIAALCPGILYYQSSHKPIRFSVLLLIILVFSVLLEIFISGKSSAILFITPLLIYFFSNNGKYNFKKLVLLGAFTLIAVPLLDQLFYYFEHGINVNIYRTGWNRFDYIMSGIRQFVYPYANLSLRKDMNEYYGWRWFIDYLAIPINMIPAFLLGGFQIKTLYDLTTRFYQQHYSFRSGIPNDILTFSYRQGAYLGIIIIFMISGWFAKAIDKRLFYLKIIGENSKINILHLLGACSMAGILFVLIEPLSAIRSQPMTWIPVVLCFHLNYAMKKSKQKH